MFRNTPNSSFSKLSPSAQNQLNRNPPQLLWTNNVYDIEGQYKISNEDLPVYVNQQNPTIVLALSLIDRNWIIGRKENLGQAHGPNVEDNFFQGPTIARRVELNKMFNEQTSVIWPHSNGFWTSKCVDGDTFSTYDICIVHLTGISTNPTASTSSGTTSSPKPKKSRTK